MRQIFLSNIIFRWNQRCPIERLPSKHFPQRDGVEARRHIGVDHQQSSDECLPEILKRRKIISNEKQKFLIFKSINYYIP